MTAFETVSAAQRADESLPDGDLGVRHYRAIHHHLFQDVYRWAGRCRTVRLSKSGSMFCFPENIAPEMRKLFVEFKRQNCLRDLPVEQFADAGATFLAALNAIHPFREGNGRSQMTFMALVAERAGRPFDLERLKPKRFLAAMVRSFAGDESGLRKELRKLIR